MRLTLVALLLLLSACRADKTAPALDGDPENGRLLLRQFGCGSCHEIPKVATARGKVGPPLDGIARRVYVAGILPNTPENMASFIRDPEKHAPRTAMPNLGVTEAHARDMVAYLYTLR
ncbi:MAG: c-type cytochrome [Betaproteobacteria bacterium]